MFNKFKTVLIVLFMVISVSSVCAQDDFKVIVNKSNTVETLSAKEISNLFLKKKLYWDNNTKVSPVDQSKDSNVRDAFSNKIHGKSTAAINAYWQKQIFSGRSVPPLEKESDKEVLLYVKNNEGAIGYVSSSTATNGVKKISIK